MGIAGGVSMEEGWDMAILCGLPSVKCCEKEGRLFTAPHGQCTGAGAGYFVPLDLASRYWQVEVAEQDCPKTAFCTHRGMF